MKYSTYIKSSYKIILALTIGLAVQSCGKEKGCTDSSASNYSETAEEDDGSCDLSTALALNFTHNFGGVKLDATNYSNYEFTTPNNYEISFSKVKYLISDIVLNKSDGESVELYDYLIVDLSNSTTQITSTVSIEKGNYSSIEFTIGFNEQDNQKSYSDLSQSYWNWPYEDGGGWYFMQIEGYYKDYNDYYSNDFDYYYGAANLNNVTEANHLRVKLDNINLDGKKSGIEIKMDIAEWFQNPSNWIFNTYNNNLTGNYTAQKAMQAQAATVFSLGSVLNED